MAQKEDFNGFSFEDKVESKVKMFFDCTANSLSSKGDRFFKKG